MKIDVRASWSCLSVGLFTFWDTQFARSDGCHVTRYSFTTVIALVFFAVEIEFYNTRYVQMSNEDKTKKTPTGKPGPLVEDETRVGGTDSKTGATKIGNKTQEGKADESVKPTDAREG